MIIDTHCHYNLDPLFEHWRQHWQKAQEYGITHSLIAGADLSSSQKGVEIARQEQNLKASLGIHPEELNQNPQDLLPLYDPKVVAAIGEVGLDYFRLDKDQKLKIIDQQKQLFIKQIKLADELNLPLIVHVRDRETPEQNTPGSAYYDALEILKTYFGFKQPFILHCVSGPLFYIKEALSLGAYIGVAGNVTYQKADQIREIVKLTPDDHLLLETDAPFLAPQNNRGQTCQPWMIGETAKYLQTELKVNLAQIYENSLKCFRIKV